MFTILCLSLGDWIQISTVAIAAIGVIIAICANINQLNTFNKQLKLNFFSDYTKRYQEILLNFPENVNDEDFSLEKLKRKEYNKTLRYMRAYFDLCSEEFYLNSKKYIDDEVWRVWEGGITFALSKTAFQQSWKVINKDTQYDNNFKKWVKTQIGNSSK